MDSEDKKTGHPFTIPENYFEEMESRILSEINVQKLAKKDSPFVAGKDFFSRLEQDILSKTTGLADEKPQTIKISYKKNRNQIYRIAAGFLLFCGLGTAYYMNASANVDIDDLSSEEMVAYLNDQSINSSEIASLIDPSDFEADVIIPEDLEINENDIYFETDNKPEKSI